MKKVFCVALSVLLIVFNFCVTAFADTIDDVKNFMEAMASMYSSIYYQNGVAADHDKLIDFYESSPGKLATLYNLWHAGTIAGIPSFFVAKNDLDTAVEHKYMALQVNQDFIDSLYTDINDDYIAQWRIVNPTSDYNLTFPSGTSTSSFRVRFNGSELINNSGTSYSLNEMNNYYSYNMVDSNTRNIVVYCGGNAPPSFVVPPRSTNSDPVLQGTVTLPVGVYFIIGDGDLLYYDVPSWSYPYSYFAPYYIASSSDNTDLTFNLARLSQGSNGLTTGNITGNFKIYHTGIATDFTNPDASFIQRWTMCAGIYLDVKGTAEDDLTITQPDDIPYDDNGDVVVLAPIDEPGEPIYISPTEYNTYIDNGDIYSIDDHSNCITTQTTTDNLYNIYNNYITNNYNTDSDSGSGSGSPYNDTNLMNKLDIIITKLTAIKNSIDNLDLSPEPNYDNFSDVTATVPLIGEIRTMITDYKTALSNDDSVPQIDFRLFGVDDSIQFDWYLPYQGTIKSILRAFAYLCGVVSCWISLKSVFGIHYGGEG